MIVGRSEFPALPEWSERIEAYLDGRLTPEPARLAATVVLLRASGDGPSAAPEVYLLKRATTMSFAGGRYAFPGGRVDPRDSDASVAWAGCWVDRKPCRAATTWAPSPTAAATRLVEPDRTSPMA